MKVLCIAFDSEELTTRLASALAQEVEVGLMLPQLSSLPYRCWLSPRVNFQPFHKPRLRQPISQMKAMRQLVERIREFDPDVIHLQKGHIYFSLALLWLRSYPLVVSIHDPKRHIGDHSSRNQLQWFLDLAYRRADQVIVHNEEMKRAAIRRLGLAEETIHITPLIERGDPEALKEVPEAGNEILFFGRIWRYKGLDHLIRAEPLIAQAIPDIRIVIAGQGEDFTAYQRMMKHPDRFVVYNEYISNHQQAELFRRASVVVLPYIEATQSGVIPVAYTYGKPVVASAVGGLPSQVDHGETGLLVPPGDEQALAEAVVHLMRDPALRRRLGANGKRKLEAEWAASVVAKQTLPVYALAVESVRGGARHQQIRFGRS